MPTIARIASLCVIASISMLAEADPIVGSKTTHPESRPEKRLALVIGNGEYKFAARLANATNDARDMCVQLGKLGFETSCYLNQRTKREMKEAVIAFAQRLSGKNEVALVFYAGHGLQVKGENFLVPTDVELRTEADADDEALNVNYLMAQLENAKSSFNIVVLDACRNNPLPRAWRSAGERGLAPIDAPTGSVIIFSTAPGKVAYDGDGKNGLFTKHLLAGIARPKLSLEDMIKVVSRNVMEEAKKIGISQSPWWNSSFTGTFCFSQCVDPATDTEITKIREERERIQASAARLQEESDQRKKLLIELDNKAKAKHSELEARIRQLESEKQLNNSSIVTDDEIRRSRTQLDQLKAERAKQDEAQRRQFDELTQLRQRRDELDRKDRELELMKQRIADLERIRLENEKAMNLERERGRLNKQPPEGGSTQEFQVPPVL